ncbi:hypothetical protein C8J23_11541 [Shewanella chilikensis]|uniref:DUF3299 domain-containing protein n=1 Tax=Shewanella chilikensis TaxID=558541 RepID=A0ABX5PN91_9GAMM|nr:hypothetical protein [Shewanella chilikensis]MCL1154705.1 hypothetical protein [Shewanella chilikensis]PYE58250.1 hypothetical protein C8J23_11541 [Shewanella chilikensis]GGZ30259.1 extracytoplasmic protein [Shewanella chilikensis]
MDTLLLKIMRLFTLLIAIGLLGNVYSGIASDATWKAFEQALPELSQQDADKEPLSIASSTSVGQEPQAQESRHHKFGKHDASGRAEVEGKVSLSHLSKLLRSEQGDQLYSAPGASQRCLSTAAPHDVAEPPYELAFEIAMPPAPLLSIGFAEQLPIEQYWTLKHPGAGLRLGGWKDANLRYRFSQQAA